MLDLFNNCVICLMTTIKIVVKLSLTEFMITTTYDRSSGPNFGCKLATICTCLVEIPAFIIYIYNIGGFILVVMVLATVPLLVIQQAS